MTNFKFRHSYNYDHTKNKGELNTLPSETIPNQSMSIQEILSRWTRGLPMTGAKVPVYNGDDLLPDLKKMDLVELDELKRSVKDGVKNAKDKLNAELLKVNKLEKEQREKELVSRLEQLEKSIQTTKSVSPRTE